MFGMRRKIKVYLIFLLLVNSIVLYAEKGILWVASDMKGAYVYLNGEKKGMTGEGYSSIALEEGDYVVKVEKLSDDESTLYRKTKEVFIGAESSLYLKFNLFALKLVEIDLFNSYKEACNDENISHCINLGYMYEKGQGTEKNEREAFLLYQKFCEGNNMLACSNLGYMYEGGFGIEQNLSKALVLYTQSCEQNNTLGCENYKILEEVILKKKIEESECTKN